MNDKKRIEATKAKLQERIDSINQRLRRAQGLSLVSDENEVKLLSDKDLEIAGKIQFFDEKWKETLSELKEKHFDEARKFFMTNFDDLLEQKVDLSELPEKADRTYVDSLLDEMNENVDNMLNDLVHQKYDGIRDQIEQAQFNMETLTQQFETNMDVLKRDLIRIKKQSTVTEEPFDPKKITQDPMKIRIQAQEKIEHNFPLMVPLSKTVKPHPVREKYRPKSRLVQPNLPPVSSFRITNEYAKMMQKVTSPTDETRSLSFKPQTEYKLSPNDVLIGAF